ncbi:MAG TPA: hypothetical protein VFH61_06325, partial [Thermoleophilia bacterium]|nr:hypothetical protein [Thermoleophilia bacterium]
PFRRLEELNQTSACKLISGIYHLCRAHAEERRQRVLPGRPSPPPVACSVHPVKGQPRGVVEV